MAIDTQLDQLDRDLAQGRLDRVKAAQLDLLDMLDAVDSLNEQALPTFGQGGPSDSEVESFFLYLNALD